MKLIRFGEPGEEKPGIQLENGTRVEIPPGFGDYDEAFFGGSGLDELKELQPMLVFCAAGVRSKKAIDFLIANGVNQVENGGGWLDVNARLNSL